ncbi:hypothetical protein RFI_35596, partial [Reticulomyxa filosa]
VSNNSTITTMILTDKNVNGSPNLIGGAGDRTHRLCQSLQHHTLIMTMNTMFCMICMICSEIWRHFAPSIMVTTTLVNIWCVWLIVRRAQWFIDNCSLCFVFTNFCWRLCIHNYDNFQEQQKILREASRENLKRQKLLEKDLTGGGGGGGITSRNITQKDDTAASIQGSKPVSFVDETLLKPHLELHFSGEKSLNHIPTMLNPSGKCYSFMTLGRRGEGV